MLRQYDFVTGSMKDFSDEVDQLLLFFTEEDGFYLKCQVDTSVKILVRR